MKVEVRFYPAGSEFPVALEVDLFRNRHGNLSLWEFAKYGWHMEQVPTMFMDECVEFIIRHKCTFDPKTHELISHRGCKNFRLQPVDFKSVLMV